MSVVINLKDVLNAQGGLLRSPSLAEDAAQTLRKMILLEKLPPGTALPERDLSQALGISRTPLREAIRLLAGEGLVQYTAARRPFVADPSLEEINDCLRIQGALEALAGELACTQASTQQIKDIAQINATIIKTQGDNTRLHAFQADMRFHQSIVKAAKTHRWPKRMPSIMPAYGASASYPLSVRTDVKAPEGNIMKSSRLSWREMPPERHAHSRRI